MFLFGSMLIAYYPKIEKRARFFAKEIDYDYSWKDNSLRNAS